MAVAKAAAILVRLEKQRVQELCNGSEILYEPEVPSKTIERLIWRHMSQKVHAKAESRTCKVCSSPCSSCTHLSIAQMGLTSDDFSDETDPVAVASQHSINEDKTGDSLRHTEHEASNLLCVNLNDNSYSENIESKATMMPSGVSVELEDVGIQRTFSNKYDGSKSVEGHDDNISCASRTSDANNKDLDIKNSSHSSLSVCSLGRSEKVLSSQKLDLSELLSIKEEGADSAAPRMQSPCSHSQSGKVAIGGSSEISSKVPKSKANIDNNSGVPLNNGGKSLNEGEQDESTELVELPDKPKSPLQALSADEGYESDATEDDVKVCDICGDAGQGDMLAICSKCSDGAEHTYCMREMLQKIPEGYWLCEECKLVEEIESQKQGLVVAGEQANKLSSSMQSLARRHAENLEGALSLKQKAIETSMKSLDNGKVKPYLQSSSGTYSGDDMLENVSSPTSGPQLQTPKCTLFKSNSFNSSSSKPKVKLVDEVVLQKQRSAREHASLDGREELGRRSKHLHVQDLKGLKKVRERISLERKSFPKLDHSSSTVSIHKVDQKLTPRADTISHSSARNKRETKVVQSDGKQSTLSRSTSNLPHKGVESAVISVPSANGRISSEQKLNQLSQMEEPSSSSSWTAEKQSNNFNGLMSDGHPRSLDLTNHSEKSRESSVSRSLRSAPCPKCKEMSHTVDSNPVSQAFGADPSSPRTSREDIYKGNKLKAAIEAAIQLRPGIRERTSHVPSSISSKANNMISVEGIHEGQENLRNQTSISNIKLLNSHSADAVSAVSSVHNSSMRDISIPPLASGSAVSKNSAIPEFEYIWQGDFEVHKRGKPPGFSAEIQAHLSTLASPKVLEVVNTFPHKVSLNEVPRLSTWPSHFHDSGPKEDNIALYFFAKDLRSYENYKVLLDTMVKNDFALKGAFEGVELLIFPSNQLPENCQRWNALLFLWGVFKGRRANSYNFVKGVHIPDASMVHVERGISIDRSAACDNTCNVVSITSSVENACISTDTVGDNKVSFCERAYVGIKKAKLEEQDGKVDSKFLPVARSSTQVHPEIKCSSPPPLEESKVPDCQLDTELKPCLQAAETNSGSVKVEKEELHVRDGDSVKIRDSMDDWYADVKTSSKRDLDCWQPNHQKRTCLDLAETVSEICTDTSQKMPWSEVKRVSMGGGSDNKKLKTGFSGVNPYNSVRDQGPFDYSLLSDTHDLCPASSVEEKKCDIACENKVIPKAMGSSEGCFFPVVSHHARELQLGDNSKPWKELSIKDEGRVHNASPNLELALGAETRPQNKEISPFFVGTFDKDKDHDKVTGKEEDDVSASFSLSLSVPIPESEPSRECQKGML